MLIAANLEPTLAALLTIAKARPGMDRLLRNYWWYSQHLMERTKKMLGVFLPMTAVS